jgi:Copper resistance protein D
VSLFWPNALPRFSLAATVSLGVIVLTGLWTAWLPVASPGQLLTTIYGQRLLIKLILLACLTALGSVNLFWVLPRAAELRRHGDFGSRGPALVQHLGRVVAAEAVLGVGIVLVVPFLSASARNQSLQTKAANLSQTLHAPAGVVKLTPSGREAGFADYDVWLSNSKATTISLNFASTELAVPATDVAATRGGDGHFRVRGIYTPMAGQWQVRVTSPEGPAPGRPRGIRPARHRQQGHPAQGTHPGGPVLHLGVGHRRRDHRRRAALRRQPGVAATRHPPLGTRAQVRHRPPDSRPGGRLTPTRPTDPWLSVGRGLSTGGRAGRRSQRTRAVMGRTHRGRS